MPYGSFAAYLRKMLPDWIDYDRLQALLVAITVLAVVLGLLCLTLVRRPGTKLLGVVLFAGLAVGAVWQLQTIERERRTDCTDVEVFGSGVVVPHCPAPSA
jgi:hypothetical protein